MSTFICDKCGTAILDSENGYVTGCEHWPLEKIERLICKSCDMTIHPMVPHVYCEDDPDYEIKTP